MSAAHQKITVKLAWYSVSTFTEAKGNDHIRKKEYILNMLNWEAIRGSPLKGSDLFVL